MTTDSWTTYRNRNETLQQCRPRTTTNNVICNVAYNMNLSDSGYLVDSRSLLITGAWSPGCVGRCALYQSQLRCALPLFIVLSPISLSPPPPTHCSSDGLTYDSTKLFFWNRFRPETVAQLNVFYLNSYVKQTILVKNNASSPPVISVFLIHFENPIFIFIVTGVLRRIECMW